MQVVCRLNVHYITDSLLVFFSCLCSSSSWTSLYHRHTHTHVHTHTHTHTSMKFHFLTICSNFSLFLLNINALYRRWIIIIIIIIIILIKIRRRRRRKGARYVRLLFVVILGKTRRGAEGNSVTTRLLFASCPMKFNYS